MAKFKVGDKVKLTQQYLQGTNEEVKRGFSGKLTIVGIDEEMVRLSNGKKVGLCRVTCNEKNIRK